MEKLQIDKFLIGIKNIDDLVSNNVEPNFSEIVRAFSLDPRTDFQGQSLRNLDFRGEDLTGFDFTNADLTGADFRRAITQNTIFTNANLTGAIGLGSDDFLDVEIADDLKLKEAKRIIMAGETPPPEWWPLIQNLRLGNSGIRSLEGLRHLSQLRSLSLRRTRVANLSPLNSLINLQELSLDDSYTTDLSSLESLVSLESLTLSSTHITDLSSIRTLLRLRHLDISHSPIRDLYPLECLRELTSLFANHIPATNYDALRGLGKLRVLSILSSFDRSLDCLSSLQSLQRLSIGPDTSEYHFINKLPQLNYLDIRSMSIQSLPNFNDKCRLNVLYIQGNGEFDIENILNQGRLSRINLHNVEVKDWTPLQQLTSLHSVNLAMTNFSEIGFLTGSARIDDLSLEGCPVFDISPLSNLRFLNHLNLIDTQVDDLSSLAEMEFLQSVSVSKEVKGVDRLLKSFPYLRISQFSRSNDGPVVVNLNPYHTASYDLLTTGVTALANEED